MLRVSANCRFLVHRDGSPFFFLADTGWTLLHRLGRDDMVRYLDDRAAKGFTVIQVKGYGAFLGARYQGAPIVWVIGGDRNPVEPAHYATWRALASGLRCGGADQPMTFHPQHHASSADFFHDEPWLAFNMIQSGHSARDLPNYAAIERDYDRVPTKPCMDGEACYEDHAINWDAANGYFDDHDTRMTAYRALFAGAHGHTYGANGVFQFWNAEGDGDRFGVRRRWQEALALPGASQMGLVRRLIESRPMLSRVPDQGLLASDPGTGGEHLRATRGTDGAYAFVYTPTGRPFAVDLGKLSGKTVAAEWVDPRTGEAHPAGRRSTMGVKTFVPPTSGPKVDWILVLDDADRQFPPLGSPTA